MSNYPHLIVEAARERAPERWASMDASAKEHLCARVHADFQKLFAVLTAQDMVLVPRTLSETVLIEASVACPVMLGENEVAALDPEVVSRLFASILKQAGIPRPPPEPATQPQQETADAPV